MTLSVYQDGELFKFYAEKSSQNINVLKYYSENNCIQ